MPDHKKLIYFFKYIDEPNLLCEECYEVGFTDVLECTDANNHVVSPDAPDVASVQKLLRCDSCKSTIQTVKKTIEQIRQMKEEQDKEKQDKDET